jgi:hypothetical protein
MSGCLLDMAERPRTPRQVVEIKLAMHHDGQRTCAPPPPSRRPDIFVSGKETVLAVEVLRARPPHAGSRRTGWWSSS